jgi:uncharacterized membrane protein
MKSTLSMLVVASLIALPAWASDKDAACGENHWQKGKQRFEQALSSLPQEKAALVRETMEKSKEKNVALKEESAKIHEEVRAISTADTFDRAAFLAKRERLRAIRNEMGTAWDQAMADVAEKLTAEERRALAAAMPKRHHNDDKAGAH